jgi:hypothetical protein
MFKRAHHQAYMFKEVCKVFVTDALAAICHQFDLTLSISFLLSFAYYILSLMINTSTFLSQWQVFSNIDEYAPGFTESIIGMEVLTPPDLEEIFGLTGGVSLAQGSTVD